MSLWCGAELRSVCSLPMFHNLDNTQNALKYIVWHCRCWVMPRTKNSSFAFNIACCYLLVHSQLVERLVRPTARHIHRLCFCSNAFLISFFFFFLFVRDLGAARGHSDMSVTMGVDKLMWKDSGAWCVLSLSSWSIETFELWKDSGVYLWNSFWIPTWTFLTWWGLCSVLLVFFNT